MKYCAGFCVCVFNATGTQPAVSSLPNSTFWVTIALTQLLVCATSCEQMDLKRDTHPWILKGVSSQFNGHGRTRMCFCIPISGTDRCLLGMWCVQACVIKEGITQISAQHNVFRTDSHNYLWSCTSNKGVGFPLDIQMENNLTKWLSWNLLNGLIHFIVFSG